jgi:outer membrane protein OmpA-like peptidoglycan-associated protein/Tol biopolymer transport system component
MKLIQFLSFILLISFSAKPMNAQVRVLQGLVEDAERQFNQGNYDAARATLTEVLKKKSDFAVAHRVLAMVYLKLGDPTLAVEHYEKVFDIKANLSRGAYYEAGEAYMKLYSYSKALELFLLYKHSQAKDYKTDEQTAQRSYDRFVDRNIASCEYSLEMGFTGTIDRPILMKGNINTKSDEFLPTLTSDGNLLLFTSNRDGNENILMTRKKDGEWDGAKSIGNAINTNYNEGMAKFTVCGRYIYFSACAWENVKGGCDIYVAEYDTKADIIDKVEPSKGLNSEFWDSQPSISCDGNTMYFASSRKGGFGGTDIWVSKLQENGSWGPAENLGRAINTEGDEEAPFIAPDGLTLYFASDGHPGLGESDIYKSVVRDDTKAWATPTNLGESINSPYREAGIVISPDGMMAYFSSARPDGKGALDIYETTLKNELKPKVDNVLLDGYLYDEKTKEVVENATVRVRSGNKSMGNFKSDKDGRFFMCVPSGASYSYIVDKAGYDNFVGADYFERAEGEPVKKIEIYMSPKGAVATAVTDPTPSVQPQVRLRRNLSVYFESGKHELSEVQKEQIRKLITQFDDVATLKLNVTGFADDVGDREFNLELSQKRASFVSEYIKELGVTTGQINSDGKGVIDTNMAKHQKRRVEIIIE